MPTGTRGLTVVLAALVLCEGSMIAVDPDGGYKNLIVAIHDSVSEDIQLLHNIREILINASEFLHSATDGRAYFKEVFIVVPETWSNRPTYERIAGNYFPSADVRIDRPNPEHGDAPYTLQPGECGEAGQYIHLTPRFVKEVHGTTYENFGNPGRQFVHEWAHLRYGVFDEYGTAGDWRYPLFYTENGRIRPTTCIRDIEGWIESKNGGPCTLVEGEVDKDCVFIPDIRSERAKASIMYMPFIPSIEGFCDDHTADRYHNTRAPTKQNAMCNYRSTLDVILSHPDFKEVRKTPVPKPKTTFRTMRSSAARYVLLLDVSGSMRGQPMNLLHRSALRFVEDRVPDGSYLGIVQFSTMAKILHPLTKVTAETRRELSKSLPDTDDNGSTAIGLGLKASLQVLGEMDNMTAGGMIILITDGEENVRPMIDEVLPDIKSADVRVNTIAFGDKATVQLEMLTKATRGRGYFFADIKGKSPATAVDSAFLESVTAQADVQLQPVEIAQKSLTMTDVHFETEVIIDKELGRNTVFTVTSSDIAAVELNVVDPSGKTFGYGNPEYDKDTSRSMRIRIRIDDAPSGRWKMIFRRRDNGSPHVNVSYSVTSEPRDPKDQPIRVRSWFSELQLKFPAHAKIFAEVRKGYNAVIGANVVATVVRPAGHSVELPLMDNGAGADVTADDGIYTAYFSQFNGNGRYAVIASIANDGSAKLKSGSTSSAGIRIPIPKEPNEVFSRNASASFDPNDFLVVDKKSRNVSDADTTVKADPFERVSDAGAFRLDDFRPLAKDTIAPNRITDLTVVKVKDADGVRQVQLLWTSPGDDLQQGNASSVSLRVSTDHDLLVNDFDSAFALNDTWLLPGSSLRPPPSGDRQVVSVVVPVILIAGNSDNASWPQETDVYFAVRASDESGNRGQVSNVAAASFHPLLMVNLDDDEEEETNHDDGTSTHEERGSGDEGGAGAVIGIVVIVVSVLIALALVVGLLVWKKRQDARKRKMIM